MKDILIFPLVALVLSNSQSIEQCNANKLADSCIPKLEVGFNFLKSFKIDDVSGTKSKVEHSYIFTKGTHYMVNLCTESKGANGIVITLYDSGRKKIGSTKTNDNIVSSLVYPCSATGIYYIAYTFESSSRCGGSTLAFKRY